MSNAISSLDSFSLQTLRIFPILKESFELPVYPTDTFRIFLERIADTDYGKSIGGIDHLQIILPGKKITLLNADEETASLYEEKISLLDKLRTYAQITVGKILFSPSKRMSAASSSLGAAIAPSSLASSSLGAAIAPSSLPSRVPTQSAPPPGNGSVLSSPQPPLHPPTNPPTRSQSTLAAALNWVINKFW